MTDITMSSILTEIGTFFSQAIEWLGDVLSVIVSNPVLLILVVAMPVCGFAVGLLRRLMSL